ncbi:MAG: pseudouridine synthase [Planctomycetaceae bacterium]
MRLQKFLATSGVDSRRNCEAYIRDGRVTVDGRIVTDPATMIDAEAHDVRFDGEKLRRPRLRYYLLNKPRGVLCTNRDPDGRPRAVDLVPAHDQRLFTVGRLDENTQGLLLITNDGDLAERLAHPRYQVVRRYRVQVVGLPTPETLAELRRGMHFSEGYFRFGSVRPLKKKGRSTVLELELREGKNREIRRLLARVGHKVISLERIAFGPLRIGHISSGKCRELRPQEIRELHRFADDLVSGRPERSPSRRSTAARPAKRSPQKRTSSGTPSRVARRSTGSAVGSGGSAKTTGRKSRGDRGKTGRR